jgi:hypothetical protein
MDVDLLEVEAQILQAEEYLRSDVFRESSYAGASGGGAGAASDEESQVPTGPVLVESATLTAETTPVAGHRRRSSNRPEIPVS